MNESKDRAKDLICKIIALNGGHVVRKGHVYKAFHAAHLFYYEQADKFLSDYPIVKMPKGPGVENNSQLFEELVAEGRIAMSKVLVGPYAADRFDYVGEPICVDPTSLEDQAIQQALEFVRDKDTNELALATHNHAWQSVELGEEMDIYVDTLTDSEIEQIEKSGKEAQVLLASIFE